jgi:RimJ/RimL family protein N-acetyltransferase
MMTPVVTPNMGIEQVRLANLNDLPAYFDHLKRHGQESGRDGDLIFAPFEEPWDRPLEGLRREKEEKWLRPITEVGWERCWILTDGNSVFGDLKLAHAIGLKTTLHRSILMMGIERSHRVKGLGSLLMREALDWANAQPTLDWIQLNVFAHNQPAKNLYGRFGFQEVGTNRDLFRVQSQKIDDTEMSLRIRREE